MDCSLPGSSVHGVLQARVAIPFFRESSQPRDRTWVSWTAGRLFTIWATREVYCCGIVAKSCPTLRETWIIAHQAHLSMGFSRQEYWSGLSCLPPGDLPNPGIKPRFPALQADSSPLSYQGSLSHLIYIILLRQPRLTKTVVICFTDFKTICIHLFTQQSSVQYLIYRRPEGVKDK